MNKQTILDFWKRDESEVKSERMDLALQRFQSQAESHLVEIRSAMLDAQEALDKAKMASLKAPDFKGVVNAKLELKRLEVAFRNAVEQYQELFGEEPKIST